MTPAKRNHKAKSNIPAKLAPAAITSEVDFQGRECLELGAIVVILLLVVGGLTYMNHAYNQQHAEYDSDK